MLYPSWNQPLTQLSTQLVHSLTFLIDILQRQGSSSLVVGLAYILHWNSNCWSHSTQWFLTSFLQGMGGGVGWVEEIGSGK